MRVVRPKNMSYTHILAAGLASYDKICITGSPGSGKTTLAGLLVDRPVIHSDQLKRDLDLVEAIFNATLGVPRYCVEGCHAMEAVHVGLPIDLMIYLHSSYTPQTDAGTSIAIDTFSLFKVWKNTYPRVALWEVVYA